VTEVDDRELTPLHVAAAVGALSSCKLLLARKANVNALSKHGKSPLYYSLQRGHPRVAKLLARFGADIQKKNIATQLSKLDRSAFKSIMSAHDSYLRSSSRKRKKQNSRSSKRRNGRSLPTNSKGTRVRAVMDASMSSLDSESLQIPCLPTNTNNRRLTAITDVRLTSPEKHPDDKKDSVIPPKVQRRARSLNFDRKAKGKSKTEEDMMALTKGLAEFNKDPKQGLAMLHLAELVDVKNPDSLGLFLFQNSKSCKPAVLGDYFGEAENLSILQAYVKHFDFKETEFVTALRRYLLTFRLPGEAQKIDRIMETFATVYYNQNLALELFRHEDAVYTLAFSTIMLNTDAHNDAIRPRDKMTKEQFINTNRGVNSGGDFNQEFLEAIYDSIIMDEIKLNYQSEIVSNADKKGWLTKQGGRIKTWKKRWFVLSGFNLLYFKDPTDPDPCGIIPLESLEVKKYTESKRKNVFILSNPHDTEIKASKFSGGTLVQGHHTEYIIQAPSKYELDSWLASLNRSVHRNPFYALLATKR